MKCENCGKEHDGKYGSGRFCGAQCARSFSTKYVSEEGRKKQKDALTNKNNRDKARNTMLQNSKNYELDDNGNWTKIPKQKKKKEKPPKEPISKITPVHNRNDMHTLVKGKIGELETAKKFANHGYNVFVPLVDISGVDMVVEKNDGLKKIQVKSSSQSGDSDNRSTEFNLYSNALCVKNGKVNNNKKTYTKDQVDYFALYSEIYDDVYLIENKGNKKSVIIRNSISPTSLTSTGKNLEKIHMAEDYQIDKVLDDIDASVSQSNTIVVDDYIEKDTE